MYAARVDASSAVANTSTTAPPIQAAEGFDLGGDLGALPGEGGELLRHAPAAHGAAALTPLLADLFGTERDGVNFTRYRARRITPSR